MAELICLGAGSAFTMKGYQSNFMICHKGKSLLIDCGSDIRFSLEESGFNISDIDAVYISHAHADHIGGLEWLGFSTLFNPTLKKPTLFAEANLMRELWTKSLCGGMEGLEGKKYIEQNGDGVLLSTYFNTTPIAQNSSFIWNEIKFDIIQTVHVTAKYALCHSYGIMYNDPDTQERVYITTDCQYSPEASMNAFYNEPLHIFQDCETSIHKSGVHANYVDLRNLAPEIKSKMWLYHYQDNVVTDYTEWNAKAVADGFRGFIKTGSRFSHSYLKQEGGYVGSLKNASLEYYRDRLRRNNTLIAVCKKNGLDKSIINDIVNSMTSIGF